MSKHSCHYELCNCCLVMFPHLGTVALKKNAQKRFCINFNDYAEPYTPGVENPQSARSAKKKVNHTHLHVWHCGMQFPSKEETKWSTSTWQQSGAGKKQFVQHVSHSYSTPTTSQQGESAAWREQVSGKRAVKRQDGKTNIMKDSQDTKADH